jgi:tungstate transport system ATP-binding protein
MTQTAPLVTLRGVEVRRGGQPVLHVDALDIFPGETLAVIGPNGAGKSTLLLCLARLLHPHQGRIEFNGQTLASLDDLAYRRRIALVLQEPLLLDRSVYDNVAAPLRFRGLPKHEVSQRVETWLERLGIAALRQRRASRLSGGEAQRASLARALALQPELLLLDEPFSALDAPTRLRLVTDLHDLLKANPVTTVFITHDLDEALVLGERVALLLGGRLRQVGPPDEIFGAPADEEAALFVGVETILPGRVTAAAEEQIQVDVGGASLYAVGPVAVGQPVLACLRPEDITLWLDGGGLPTSSARNRLVGVVQSLTPRGPLVRVDVALSAAPKVHLVAYVTRPSAQEMPLAPGVQVTLTFKASAVHLLPR